MSAPPCLPRFLVFFVTVYMYCCIIKKFPKKIFDHMGSGVQNPRWPPLVIVAHITFLLLHLESSRRNAKAFYQNRAGYDTPRFTRGGGGGVKTCFADKTNFLLSISEETEKSWSPPPFSKICSHFASLCEPGCVR